MVVTQTKQWTQSLLEQYLLPESKNWGYPGLCKQKSILWRKRLRILDLQQVVSCYSIIYSIPIFFSFAAPRSLLTFYRQSTTICLTTIQSYDSAGKRYDLSSNLRLLYHPHSHVITIGALGNQLAFPIVSMSCGHMAAICNLVN